MKVCIKDKEIKEPEIQLELEQRHDCVILCAYGTENGVARSKAVLMLDNNGEISIIGSAQLDELKTDKDGFIKVKKHRD